MVLSTPISSPEVLKIDCRAPTRELCFGSLLALTTLMTFVDSSEMRSNGWTIQPNAAAVRTKTLPLSSWIKN